MVDLNKKIASVLGVALFAIATGVFAWNQGLHQTTVINTAEAQANAPVSVTFTMDGLKDSVPVSSYTWNASSLANAGAGGGAGRVTSSTFHLTFTANKNSPDLMKAATNGKNIRNASIVVNNNAGKPLVKWTFADCRVTSYTTSEKAGAEPMDEIDISFGRMTFEYTSGTTGETTRGDLDLTKIGR